MKTITSMFICARTGKEINIALNIDAVNDHNFLYEELQVFEQIHYYIPMFTNTLKYL